MTERLLSVAQLAAQWGWHKGRIYRLIEADQIPVLRLPNGYFFEPDRVAAWLDQHRVAPERQAPAAPVAPRGRSREEECRAFGISPDHLFSRSRAKAAAQ